jgi:hypothetical protein
VGRLLKRYDTYLSQRRRLAEDVAAQSGPGTALQQTNIQECQLQVEKHIAVFHTIQAAYMPEVTCLVAAMSSGNNPESHPENQSLMLSSQLPPLTHTSNPGLADMERKLQYAQATDSIVELCQYLIVCAHLTKYKVDQVCGQNPNTCAQTLLNKAEAQTNRIALKYTVAWKSYLTLVGSDEWESVLKPLWKHNLCDLSVPEDDATQMPRDSPGEGHQTLSWIWITSVAPHGDDTSDMHEGMLQTSSHHWAILRVP